VEAVPGEAEAQGQASSPPWPVACALPPAELLEKIAELKVVELKTVELEIVESKTAALKSAAAPQTLHSTSEGTPKPTKLSCTELT
jgi:hypothetical protein